MKEEEECNRFNLIRAINGKFEISKVNLKLEEYLYTCVSNFDFLNTYHF